MIVLSSLCSLPNKSRLTRVGEGAQDRNEADPISIVERWQTVTAKVIQVA